MFPKNAKFYALIESLKNLKQEFILDEDNYCSKITWNGRKMVFFDDPMISDNELITLDNEQQKIIEDIKLTIELVPSTCQRSKAPTYIKDSQWKQIKSKVFENSNHVCEICGGTGSKHPLECHEVWNYFEESHMQVLSKFMAICPLCHQVKHILNTKMRDQDAYLRAIKRFQEINNLTVAQVRLFMPYYEQIYVKRSKNKWDLDISLIEKYGIKIPKVTIEYSERKNSRIHKSSNSLIPK